MFTKAFLKVATNLIGLSIQAEERLWRRDFCNGAKLPEPISKVESHIVPPRAVAVIQYPVECVNIAFSNDNAMTLTTTVVYLRPS